MRKPPSDLQIQLDSIVKTKKLLTKDYIEQNWVGSFIIKRFVTSVDIEINTLRYIVAFMDTIKVGVFESNWDEYLYMYHTVPKISGVRFVYPKKSKPQKPKINEEKVKDLAGLLEISEKETKYFVENQFLNTNYE